MESKTKVILGSRSNPVRFSYAHVFEPKAIQEGQTPKYSVSILIDKEDETSLSKLEKAVNAAKEDGKSKKWNGKIPAKLKLPLRDGDEERPDDEAYKGKYFLNASANRKPGVVDANVEEVFDQDEFYSGCYGRASINMYPFNSNGNKGVAAGLGNVQKLEEGDRLSGGSSAAEDFGEEQDDLMG